MAYGIESLPQAQDPNSQAMFTAQGQAPVQMTPQAQSGVNSQAMIPQGQAAVPQDFQPETSDLQEVMANYAAHPDAATEAAYNAAAKKHPVQAAIDTAGNALANTFGRGLANLAIKGTDAVIHGIPGALNAGSIPSDTADSLRNFSIPTIPAVNSVTPQMESDHPTAGKAGDYTGELGNAALTGGLGALGWPSSIKSFLGRAALGAGAGGATSAALTPLMNATAQNATLNPEKADWSNLMGNAENGAILGGIGGGFTPARQANAAAPEATQAGNLNPGASPQFPGSPPSSPLSQSQVAAAQAVVAAGDKANPAWANAVQTLTDAANAQRAQNGQAWAGNDPTRQAVAEAGMNTSGNATNGKTLNAGIGKTIQKNAAQANKAVRQAQQTLNMLQKTTGADPAAIQQLQSNLTAQQANAAKWNSAATDPDLQAHIDDYTNTVGAQNANGEGYYTPMAQYGQQTGANRGSVPASAMYNIAGMPAQVPGQRGAWTGAANIADQVNGGSPTNVNSLGGITLPDANNANLANHAQMTPAEGNELFNAAAQGTGLENGQNMGDQLTGTGQARTPEQQARQGNIFQANMQRIAQTNGQQAAADLTQSILGPSHTPDQQAAAAEYLNDKMSGKAAEKGYTPPAGLEDTVKQAIDSTKLTKGGAAQAAGKAVQYAAPMAGQIAGTLLEPSGILGGIGGRAVGDIAGKAGEWLANRPQLARNKADIAQDFYEKLPADQRGIAPQIKQGLVKTGLNGARGGLISATGANTNTAGSSNAPMAQENPSNNSNNQPPANAGNVASGAQNPQPARNWADMLGDAIGALGAGAAMYGGMRSGNPAPFNPYAGQAANALSDQFHIPFGAALSVAQQPAQLAGLYKDMAEYGNTLSPAQQAGIMKFEGQKQSLTQTSGLLDQIQKDMDTIDSSKMPLAAIRAQAMLPADAQNPVSQAYTRLQQEMNMAPSMMSTVYNINSNPTDASRAEMKASHATADDTPAVRKAWLTEMRQQVNQKSDWVNGQEKTLASMRGGKFQGGYGGENALNFAQMMGQGGNNGSWQGMMGQ